MADDFLSNLASGLKVWGGVSDAFHKRDVSNRVDQIMKASNGGRSDLSMLDPSLTSDGVGMEAMGQVAASLSKTGEAQNQIFQNALVGAQNQWKMAKQYQTDFDKAVEDQREGDAANLLISMGNSMGIPYRYSLGEDGRINVKHVTPDGEVDMGNMSLVEASQMAKQYLGNQDQFVRNSVMHNMTMADTNAQIQAAGAGKWMHGVDPRTGRQVMAFPQYNLQNGGVEYIVQGVGKVSAEQLANLGIQWGTAAQSARIGLQSAGVIPQGRGRGLGGGGRAPRPAAPAQERPGRKATPGQVTVAYEKSFSQGMADQGYIRIKGQWHRTDGMGGFEPVDVSNDEDFLAAAQQSHAQTVDILESYGYNARDYKPRYGNAPTPAPSTGGSQESPAPASAPAKPSGSESAAAPSKPAAPSTGKSDQDAAREAFAKISARIAEEMKKGGK